MASTLSHTDSSHSDLSFSRNTSAPHVALLIETSITYGRGVLRGISRYLRKHGPWSVYLEQRELGAELPGWIDRWRGQGILTRSNDRRLLDLGIPAVGLFDHTAEDLGLPMILNDSRAVGRLAAEHLIERGFRHLAFFGVSTEPWSLQRLEGAQAAARKQGCSWRARLVAPRRENSDWETGQDHLADWIADLPRPLGLIACNDMHGQRVLDACARRELVVPEQVAVVGADDDQELCEFAPTPLSSVAFDSEKVGHEAAGLLDRLMRGEPAPRQAVFIPPLGVIARQSSDAFAVEDPMVARALQMIRRQACSGLSVEDLLDPLPVSRRWLELRFRRLLGRSPKQEIHRVQIDRARLLLSETDLPVTTVATRCGFHQPSHFGATFRKITGLTPSAFRLKHATLSGI